MLLSDGDEVLGTHRSTDPARCRTESSGIRPLLDRTLLGNSGIVVGDVPLWRYSTCPPNGASVALLQSGNRPSSPPVVDAVSNFIKDFRRGGCVRPVNLYPRSTAGVIAIML